MFNAGGPQFVFNMGGGPGFTVHRMGGGTPRRRPRADGEPEPQAGGWTILTQLLPLFLLFVLPLLSSLFSGSSSSVPDFRFDHTQPPHTEQRTMPQLKVPYWVNPHKTENMKKSKLSQLDRRAEAEYVTILRQDCQEERIMQQQLYQDAQGWFTVDERALRKAREYKLMSCSRLDELRVPRYNQY